MLKYQMDAGTGVAGNNKVALTIDELIACYEVANLADGKSAKTIRWYGEILSSFLSHLKTEEICLDLLSFDIDAVRAYILFLRHKPRFQGHPYTPQQDEPISPRTLQCHVRVLKAFSSWLYLEGYTAENRLKNLKLPKAPDKIVEPLTPEETKTVIASIDKATPTGFRNYAILLTVLDTGLRASEVANIRLGNLNLDGGFVKVMGKGAKERIVPIGKVVQKTLWQYIDMVRAKPASNEGDNLFLSSTGQPITVNTIKLMFSRLAKTSGVTRLHTHLCRHTFAINYLINGGDIFSLQEILGHTTLEMVRHYLHFTSSQVAAQHHKYSPIDKLHSAEEKAPVKGLGAMVAVK
jgi:site-specific recombinase XerD